MADGIDDVQFKFVTLADVAQTLSCSVEDMADVLRSPKFTDADKAAFADFVLSTKGGAR